MFGWKSKQKITCPEESRCSIPEGWVDWFRGVDARKLELLLEQSKKRCADAFFQVLEASREEKLPTAETLVNACSVLMGALDEEARNPLWLETLAGETLSEENQTFLRDHLSQLRPPLEVPNPTTLELDCRPFPLCILAGLGAFGGMFLGGWLAGNMHLPSESGMLVGAPLCAFLSLWGGFFLLNRPSARKKVGGVLGVAAAVDVGVQAAKEAVPILGGKGRFGFILRMLSYAVAGVLLFFLKKRAVYNEREYRNHIENLIRNWLLSVTAILLVLMRKQKDEKIIQNQNEDTLGLVKNVKRLQAASADEIPACVKELVQSCENLGYSMENVSEVNFCWDEEMAEKYVPIDFVRNGDRVLIVVEAVARHDGEVLKKGSVRKYRGN